MTDFQVPNNSYEMMLAILGGINPKSVNTMQDLSSYLFNPQYGITGDTYESAYTLPAPYVPNTPRLDAYMNSTNPIWRDVASGIQDGSLDEASAVAALYNGLGFTYDTEVKQGLSLADVRSAVKEMFDEKERDLAARIEYDQNLLEAERENIFGKAGLPQPYDQWTADNMPISDDLRAFMSRLSEPDADAVKSAEKLAKTRMLSTMLGIGNKVDVSKSEEKKTGEKSTDGGSDKSFQSDKNIFDGDPSKSFQPNGKNPVGAKSDKNIFDGDPSKSFQPNGKNPIGAKSDKNIFDGDPSKSFQSSAKNPIGAKGNTGFMLKDSADGVVSQQNVDGIKKAILSVLMGIPSFGQETSDTQQAYDREQKALAQNRAIAALRLEGEKIGLGLQGRTPLEEALRRRALGLQGM